MIRWSSVAVVFAFLVFCIPATSSAHGGKGKGKYKGCKGNKANKMKVCKTKKNGKIKGKWIKAKHAEKYAAKGYTDAPMWFVDSDGDGYGDANDDGVAKCKAPKYWAGVDNNADCDDSDAAVNPAAVEIPDGVDNNCDGAVDEGGGGGAECPCFSAADLAPIGPIETCGGADFGDSYFNTITSHCSSAETGGVFEVGTNYCVMSISDCDSGDVLASSYVDGISGEESAACREAMESQADAMGAVCDFFTEETNP